MPSVISGGASDFSAATVVDPTDLLPDLPSPRSVYDWMFCWTVSTSTSATVTTPADWQLIFNVVGTYGTLALFAKRIVGDEVSVTVTWSGLTTGASGTPCIAEVINMGTGFAEDVDGRLIVNVLGPVSNQAASSTVFAAGGGMTTTVDGAIVLLTGVRRDDTLSGWTQVGTGVTTAIINSVPTTSGADAHMLMWWGVMPTAGVLSDYTWTITGAVSSTSSGVMVALVPTPPEIDYAPTLIFTRGH
jgi:hypothetical protein